MFEFELNLWDEQRLKLAYDHEQLGIEDEYSFEEMGEHDDIVESVPASLTITCKARYDNDEPSVGWVGGWEIWDIKFEENDKKIDPIPNWLEEWLIENIEKEVEAELQARIEP